MVIIYEHDLGMVVLICGISTHITEAGELVQETRTRYRVGDITAWTIIFFQIFSFYVCIWFYIKIIKKIKKKHYKTLNSGRVVHTLNASTLISMSHRQAWSAQRIP